MNFENTNSKTYLDSLEDIVGAINEQETEDLDAEKGHGDPKLLNISLV